MHQDSPSVLLQELLLSISLLHLEPPWWLRRAGSAIDVIDVIDVIDARSSAEQQSLAQKGATQMATMAG